MSVGYGVSYVLPDNGLVRVEREYDETHTVTIRQGKGSAMRITGLSRRELAEIARGILEVLAKV